MISLIFIGFILWPSNRDPRKAACLCNAVRSLASAHPGIPLWIAADLNLSDINWEGNSISGHQYPKVVNVLFFNQSSDLGLKQMVNKHT